MAYVPPHKRVSKKGSSQNPTPTPKPELPPFHTNNKNSKHNSSAAGITGYAYEDIHRWFAAGLDDRNLFPPSVDLQPLYVESANENVVQRLALFNNTDSNEKKSNNRLTKSFNRGPWEYIAETVLPDIHSSFEDFRNKMEESDQNHVKFTPLIILRFGKVLFRRGCALSEELLRGYRASFYTDILDSYIEYILEEGASESGLKFKLEKEVYIVFIEHSYAHHMLRDISCLEKNLDLRLDLSTKKLVTNFSDDDLGSLKNLISSAVVDKDVKGGLTWPMGMTFSGEKFKVVKVWRVRSKVYKNQRLRLKIKDVNRSLGREATKEVVIMLKGVVSELMKKDVDRKLISEMLKNDLKVIWDNFLCCERFPKSITEISK
ncbi:hypothetical protein F8388_012740 [Cannabis sativa]|uniref:DUF7903 domain-containing protein n=1 Tax=Cannabis sativa TaxID=3483 RepID=A0A7J6GNE9_CANSA|nr:hypothetical protein G4B88_028506 [Cannabis sativa]KAF4392284.1 hypothetical protein F8388_012740 [Cannabis sativa]